MLSAIRLDSATQTLVLASWDRRLPELVYWSSRLGDDVDVFELTKLQRRSIGHSMLDEVAELSLLPESGRAFPGHPGLVGHSQTGTRWTGQFMLDESLEECRDGKRVIVNATDAAAGLRVSLRVTIVEESEVLVLCTDLENIGDDGYFVDWLACPVVPIQVSSSHMIGFFGRWCQEFRRQEIPWVRGSHVRQNRLGRTSHEHFPGLIVPALNCSETVGEAYGFHLGWSGNHQIVAEELPDGRRQVQFGTLPDPGEILLQAGDTHSSPELYAVFSDQGLNGVSQKLHEHCRRKLVTMPAWLQERPVVSNSWEAVYFDHCVDELKAIATSSAELGAELFVLDDGWFAGRDDHTAGLGDWWADPVKYPDGLHPVVDHVLSLGMRFGLWLEPEMVSYKSELYRDHPDWVLDLPRYQQVLGRTQLVLDLSRDEVQEYVWRLLSRLFEEYEISYIKWDMNRSLSLAAGAFGTSVAHRFVHGVYALMDRILRQYPAIAIESCSSGGGRMDFEILKRAIRLQLSDCLDPVERLSMQKNASYFFPPEAISSHMGAANCHTTGRTKSLRFASRVAAVRHMGIELDPCRLSKDERDCVRRGIVLYKTLRSWAHKALFFRLEFGDAATFGEVFVSHDRSRFFAVVSQAEMQGAASTGSVKIPGLAAGSRYRVQILNAIEASRVANCKLDSPLLSENGCLVDAEVLAKSGIALPNLLPETNWLIDGVTEAKIDTMTK